MRTEPIKCCDHPWHVNIKGGEKGEYKCTRCGKHMIHRRGKYRFALK